MGCPSARDPRGEGGDHRPPGSRLQDALDALAALEKEASCRRAAIDGRATRRPRLVDAAACSLWTFTVQRDCAGLGWMTKHVLEGYAVPPEVSVRMGAVPCPLRDN